MFEIRELRHLLSIAEFRHFGRAAKAVGLSQPALTKSLQRIERAMGAKLFERSRAGVIPTDVGMAVLVRARRLVEDADDMKREVDAMTGSMASEISIGIGPAMSETYIGKAVSGFVSKHRQTQVAIRVDHWQQLADWLLLEEIDFYVADVGSAQFDGRFHYTPLPDQNFVWFCRKNHPLNSPRRKKKVTRSELLRYPISTPKLPPWAVEWFTAACGEEGGAGLPRPFPAIECESYALLKGIVASSDCISAALEQTLTREVEEGTLAVLPMDAPDLTTHAGILRLKNRPLGKLATELIDWIESHAETKPPC